MATAAEARRLIPAHLAGHVEKKALAFEAGLHLTLEAHVEWRARNVALDNLEGIAAALGVQS